MAKNHSDEWLEIAVADVRRMQEEFRALQSQSHSVIGVGAGLVGIGSAFGTKMSVCITLAAATIAFGIVMTWYLNINAEASVVGDARDDLTKRIHERLQDHDDEPRAIYSDLVQTAGRNHLSSVALVVGFEIIGIGLAIVGFWAVVQEPMRFKDVVDVPTWLRWVMQSVATGYSLSAVGLALYATNGSYTKRYADAKSRDNFGA